MKKAAEADECGVWNIFNILNRHEFQKLQKRRGISGGNSKNTEITTLTREEDGASVCSETPLTRFKPSPVNFSSSTEFMNCGGEAERLSARDLLLPADL